MKNLETNYLGLTLKNPLIAGSSGYTDSLDKLKKIEDEGAGAVILKSLFEEEILHEMKETFNQMTSQDFIYPETSNFFEYEEIEDTLSKYVRLVSDAKKSLSIPVIASINCVSSQKWTFFAEQLEEAGADALEINAFVLPSEFGKTSEQYEKVYFDIVKEVKKHTKLPIALKLSSYFSNLAEILQQLSKTEVGALTLFNRFYSPDFNLNNLKLESTHVLSNSNDYVKTLHWIGLMAGKVDCDLSASTGVHDADTFIKMLLAGADTVQIASALYKKNYKAISELLKGLEDWMDTKEYDSITDFKGKMSKAKVRNPAIYERVQFMKYFGGR